MKNKLLKGAMALSLLTNAGTAGYLFTELKEQETKISDLKGDVKTKSSEIANLSDVIAKKDDNLNANKKVIEKQKVQIEKTHHEMKQLKDVLRKEEELRKNAEKKFLMAKNKKKIQQATEKANKPHVTEKSVSKANVATKPVSQQKAVKASSPKQATKQATKQSVSSTGRNVGTFEMTAYVATCNGCSGITASGYNVKNTVTYNGMRIIATDTSIIPMHSIVRITTANGSFNAISLDTGGAIHGHIIDYLVSSESEAMSIGRQNVKIEIIGSE